ncbi:MAG: HNH endonuclease [Cytophagales bacterium]|nr:HNH endonuclease [Cytophagales bacterium]MDW8383674.1 AP2/ERF family transcription factor [Flammeovirgaceae bacterium]
MVISLINSDKTVLLCEQGANFLQEHQLVHHWRLHSAGYAVLQYMKEGKLHTFYMHKLLAEHFIKRKQTHQKLFVCMKNGNKLDCRLSNLEWVTMSDLRRRQERLNKFRGIARDGNRFRAVLYDKGKRIYLGLFNTAEEAALAYDQESFKRFGFTKSLNFPELFLGKEPFEVQQATRTLAHFHNKNQVD